MLVSVIIPNYNHAEFLDRRISSVLEQSFQNFELIILDDCSTDGSREIIEKYRGHPKISQIVYNRKNTGKLFRQWKKGIDLAKGVYIWIAESDDFAEPDFLKRTLEIFSQDPQIGLVFCDAKIVDDKNIYSEKVYSQIRNTFYNGWNCSYIHEGQDELDRSLKDWCSINNASAVLFKTKELKKNKVNLKKFYYGGDWLTYIAIAGRCKIAYLHEPLSYYRDHNKNASRKSYTTGRIYIDHFRIYQYYLDKVYRQGDFSKNEYIASKTKQIMMDPYYYLGKTKYLFHLLKYLLINPFLFSRFFVEFIRQRRHYKHQQNAASGA